MIYFTAHTFKCVCHCRRAMFRVLGMYNFDPAINYWIFSASVNKKKVPSGAPGWSVFRQENGRTLKVLTHKPNIITSQTQQPLQIFFTASCSIRYNLME